MFTPHLGYLDKYKNWEEAKNEYIEEKEMLHTEFYGLFNDTRSNISHTQTNFNKVLTGVQCAIDLLENIIHEYKHFTTTTQSSCQNMFNTYYKSFCIVQNKNLPENAVSLSFPDEIMTIEIDLKEASSVHQNLLSKKEPLTVKIKESNTTLKQLWEVALKNLDSYFQDIENTARRISSGKSNNQSLKVRRADEKD